MSAPWSTGDTGEKMPAKPADRSEIADRIEAYVRQVGNVETSDREFSRETHLFESGYLDSIAAVRLIEYVEQAYDLTLSEEQLLSPMFTTIDGMSTVLWAELADS
jgi:acyl carrier protein